MPDSTVWAVVRRGADVTHVAVVEDGTLNAAVKSEQQAIEEIEGGASYVVWDETGPSVEVVTTNDGGKRLHAGPGSGGGVGKAVADALADLLESLGLEGLAERVRRAGGVPTRGRNVLAHLPAMAGPDAALGEDLRRRLVEQLLTNAGAAGVDCPPELLMAMAIQETPTTAGGELFHNGGDVGRDADGIMQVTSGEDGSGHHEESGPYDNTVEGIENNIRDGLTVFGDENLNRYDTDCVCATVMYNGGAGFCTTYNDLGIGDDQYLEHVAWELENRVPEVFGQQFANPDLVAELREAQEVLDEDCRQLQDRCIGGEHEIRLCREGGSSAAYWRVEFTGEITGGDSINPADTRGQRTGEGRLGSTCPSHDTLVGTGVATVTHRGGPTIRVTVDGGDPTTLEEGQSREFPSGDG